MSVPVPRRDLLVEASPGHHIVQLYGEEPSLLESVALYARVGFEKGEAVVLVATTPHLEAVGRHLTDQGFDVSRLERLGQLKVRDAAELLDSFMVNGRPDAARFQAAVGGLVEQAREGGRYPRVRVYGEMVNLLWRDALPAATRLELLWNDLIEAQGIALFCAYCVRGVEEARLFPGVLLALHSHVIPLESCG